MYLRFFNQFLKHRVIYGFKEELLKKTINDQRQNVHDSKNVWPDFETSRLLITNPPKMINENSEIFLVCRES
jgi:hypothetical protein